MMKSRIDSRWFAIYACALSIFAGKRLFAEPIAPAAPRYSVRVERSLLVPMRDGVKLSTDLYFPEAAEEKLPVILLRTPYDKKVEWTTELARRSGIHRRRPGCARKIRIAGRVHRLGERSPGRLRHDRLAGVAALVDGESGHLRLSAPKTPSTTPPPTRLTSCCPSFHDALVGSALGRRRQTATQPDSTGYTMRMHCARQQISIYLLIGFGLGCGHVEPNPQPDASKPRLIVDRGYFETHPESEPAWIVYAMQQNAMPEAGEYQNEVDGRRKMVGYWKEAGTSGADRYLDLMVTIEELGFLEEYVIAAFSRPGWTVPAAAMADLDIPAFFAWAEKNLQGHVGETRAFLDRPRPETPGALYPPAETFVDASGPRCDKKKEFDRVLGQWELDRDALIGRLLAVPDGVDFLYYLDMIGTDGDLSRTGATQVTPSIVDLLFIGGYCATERFDLKAAQHYFEEASSLDPYNTSVRMELAHVWIQRRKFEPAEEQIEFVLGNSQDPCVIAVALRKRGFIEFERGELTQAYATYTESLNHEPGSELAKSELSLIYQTMEARGFEDLPPPEYVPPPSEQMTTQCTL